MKMIQKLFAAALLAAIVTATMPALAESTGLQVTDRLNGGTNNVAAASTNTYISGTTFTTTKSSTINIDVRIKLDGAGTAGVPIWFDGSIDNSNWVTNGILGITLTAAGTATVVASTNLNTLGFAYVRVGRVGNLNAQNVTNITIKAFAKAAGF